MRKTLLSMLTLFFFASFGSPQEQHRIFRIPFHTANGLILLNAELNCKPAIFLLDSGSNVSFVDVNSSSIRFKAQKVRRLGMSGCLAEHSRLNLGGWETSEQKMCIADLSDVSKDVATRIAGLIGGTVLEQFSVVRIDYRAHEVQFEQ